MEKDTKEFVTIPKEDFIIMYTIISKIAKAPPLTNISCKQVGK